VISFVPKNETRMLLFGSSLGQVICGAILAADLQLVRDTTKVSHSRFLHELTFQQRKAVRVCRPVIGLLSRFSLIVKSGIKLLFFIA
jgi:hypothetical protein